MIRFILRVNPFFFHEIEESINNTGNKGTQTHRDQKKEFDRLQTEFKEEMEELTSRIVINKSESPLTVLEESEEAVEYILTKKYPGVDSLYYRNAFSTIQSCDK